MRAQPAQPFLHEFCLGAPHLRLRKEILAHSDPPPNSGTGEGILPPYPSQLRRSDWLAFQYLGVGQYIMLALPVCAVYDAERKFGGGSDKEQDIEVGNQEES